jgi:hypothetical protein
MTASLRIRSFGLIAFAAAALAGPLVGTADAVPPATRTPPLDISGGAVQNDTLDANTGTWDNTPTSTTDQWYDCPDNAISVSCTPVSSNGTGTSYVLTAQDVGKWVYMSEFASNADGPSPTENSSLIGPIAAPVPDAPINSTRPSITGTTTSGQLLTEGGDAWTGSPTSKTWQWLRCTTSCTSITTNGNAQTYTLTDADVGATIKVQMTASNSNPTPSAPATSDPTATIVGVTPTNVNKPAITGTTTDGSVLTESGDTWNGGPTTFTYQWLRCTTTCTSITTNGNAKTYTLQDADVGATIEVQMTASNSNPTPSAAATSNPTAAIVGATPTIVTSPTISGTPALGQVLTETGDTWTGSPTTFTYQWLRCTTTCTSITTNGTAKTYTLVAADVGDTIEVQMTAGYSNPTRSAIVTSAPTTAVVPPPPSIVAAPTISGTAQVGNALTEGAARWGTTWPPTSTPVQWYRCDSNNLNCVAIAAPAGIAKTYTLTNADVGATMQVTETATNAGGSTTNYSGFSGAVTNAQKIVPVPNVVGGSTPAISGSAQLGRTLTGSGAQFDSNPGTFNYQWLRCNALGCVLIPGETGLTYTPTSADIGDSIAFAESASNSGGTSATVQSARTDTITAPSTTALQSNSAAPFAGQTVTLIATVTSAAGSVKPAGTVDFRDGGTAVPGCTGLPLGSSAPTAVCQTSFPASVANVTAAYSAAPGTFITGSTSSPTTLIVGRALTSVTVAASGHVSLGAKTTYTATVHPPAGSSLTPTGRVTFTDSGKTIKGCGSKALAAHKAPCSIKYLGLKQHRISARYSGDANFAPSASITSHVLVQPQAPSGFVAVFMSWSFNFTLHATRIAQLDATGLSVGIHIAVTCSGGGCPFASRAMTVSAHGKCGKPAKRGCVAAPSFNLASIFHRARLHVGTRVAVAVTHRGWVGKYYRFTIRKGRKPAIDVSCLAVNGTRPGVGCSAR